MRERVCVSRLDIDELCDFNSPQNDKVPRFLVVVHDNLVHLLLRNAGGHVSVALSVHAEWSNLGCHGVLNLWRGGAR